MSYRLFVAFLVGLIIPFLSTGITPSVFANSDIDALRNQIAERNNRLAEIQKEIDKYEAELKKVGSAKKTLQNAIRELELERKKINAEIIKTENQIKAADLSINKLVLEISKTKRQIEENQEAVASIIRAEYQDSEMSLLEQLLSNKKLSEFWNTYEAHQKIRNTLADKIVNLQSLKEEMEAQRREKEAKRKLLAGLKKKYTDQNKVLINNKQEQTKLLEVTKKEEKNYQQVLATKKKVREEIERELREFESKLQFILDPNTIPPSGTQVFNWPLASFVITQFFGGTEFAARNAAVYGGRPYHSGLDMAAPRGTPILAALSGTVRATGNTDAVPGCYSWGKWTLIDHANGLATLYAHQSVISVMPGQKVNTGDIIGYVGNTGYSTGPHLHFTVYAKEGVKVRKFNEIKTVTSCGPASTPVAATDAYLDPMLYLPPY